MLTDNDMYDLAATFVRIRNNVRYPLNEEILHQLISVINNKSQYCDNQFRKALSQIENLDKEIWYFAYCNNVYVRCRIIQNTSIYNILMYMCENIKQFLSQKNFKQAYDLIDAIHCLPVIIVESNFSIPKSYWKTYIKPYRDKWDKNFLLKEQNECK